VTLEAFRSERASTKRRAILVAAREAFARQGFASASTADIARVAEVSTATLYRYFATKTDLFAATVRQEVDGLRAALARDASRDAWSRLRELSVRYAELLLRPDVRGMIRAVIAENRDGSLTGSFYSEGKATVGALFETAITEAVGERGGTSIALSPHALGQIQAMIEHQTLLPGLLAGDDTASEFTPEDIADEALSTWRARWLA
jgi:AcrR family transcriptional regulator